MFIQSKYTCDILISDNMEFFVQKAPVHYD